MFKKVALFSIVILLVGCHAKKTAVYTPTTRNRVPVKIVTTLPTTNKTVVAKSDAPAEVIVSTSKTKVSAEKIAEYVEKYKKIAMSNMKTYGIPASIILAQGILESGSGYGDLALTANNHFGIKCHENWTGDSVRHDDDSPQECFRKYPKADESFKDHAVFLTGRPRYAGLFQLGKGDYKSWAKGLRAKGYATDPKYPEKLIYYIDKYKLHQYDNDVLGIKNEPIFQDTIPVIVKNTPIISTQLADIYEVVKGDTLYSLSKRFNVSMEKLKEMNPVLENGLHLGDQLKIKE